MQQVVGRAERFGRMMFATDFQADDAGSHLCGRATPGISISEASIAGERKAFDVGDGAIDAVGGNIAADVLGGTQGEQLPTGHA